MAQTQRHLKIGESILIKRGLMTRISLLYAGMPNERTCSLVVIRTAGHTGMAYNLYLPTDQRHATLHEASITIHGVSPASLQLTVE
jgi:hypothetical protein